MIHHQQVRCSRKLTQDRKLGKRTKKDAEGGGHTSPREGISCLKKVAVGNKGKESRRRDTS
jgi:hypothetical protein